MNHHDQMFLLPEAPKKLRRNIVFDYFAGAGGASTGIEQAIGRPVDVAINHCQHAVEIHKLNHPSTKHLQVDVWDLDPCLHLPAGDIDLAWLSPDCTHFSRARGGTPVSKKIRGLAWVGLRLASKRFPRMLMQENVPEFLTWGPVRKRRFGRHKGKVMPITTKVGNTFRRYVEQLRDLGYKVEWRVLNAADYGAPTCRKRLILIARCDGRPIVWPEATHGPGRAQPYRTAGECIDWSIPCPSIFDRKRPLADATMRRIAAGLVKFVLTNPTPFIVQVNHGRDTDRSRSLEQPMPTITSHHGFGLVTPWFVRIGNAEREGQKWRVEEVDAPLNTIVAQGRKQGLVVAFLAKHYGGVVGHAPDRPLGTVTARDHHSAIVCTLSPEADKSTHIAAFLTKFYSSARKHKKGAPVPGAPLDGPAPVVSAQGQHVGLVTVEIEGEAYAIVDIGLRMLTPRELARCQGFDDGFLLEGTQAQQVARIGNSVPPPLAKAIVAANFASVPTLQGKKR